MKVLDLFSGVGGFALGLERAGFETAAFCEIEKYQQKVLEKWWPSIPVWQDIKTLNFCLRKVLGSSAAASRAKIYQWQEKAPELPAPVQDSSGIWFAPFAWFDRQSQSWKTWQRCLIGEWESFSGTWPSAGMMRNGVAYQPEKSAPRTSAKEYGLFVQTPTKSNSIPSKNLRDAENRLPTAKEYSRGWWERKGKRYSTPTANDGKNATLPPSQAKRNSLVGDLIREGNNGLLNPRFVEWLMGFPLGWTELAQGGSPSAACGSLGNAVVPQIPELIGKAIKEAIGGEA